MTGVPALLSGADYTAKFPEDRCPWLDVDGNEQFSYRWRNRYVKEPK